MAENKMTKEVLKAAKGTRSVEELQKLAKENGMVVSATNAALEQIHKGMATYADQLTKQIESGTKEAFAKSIAHMLSRALWIVIAGVLLILLIPEVPLRAAAEKSPPPAEA